MSLSLLLAVGIVLMSFAIAGYAIWQWGPGLRERSVMCPMLRRSAKVLVDQREAEFGNLKMADIRQCSLLHGPEVTCSKECLRFL